MAKNSHGEAQPYLPSRKWVDGSIADDLPAKRLSRLFSTNHYIVSMVNPVVIPFLRKDGQSSVFSSALGGLGVGLGREVLNLYKGFVQKRGDKWPRLNMFVNGIHSFLDQEYSGDVNIVPNFRWYNPGKLLSHLSEKDLMELVDAGEHSTFSSVETIRTCTKISRTMEEILHRFEFGDLRPEATVYRPRSSRRRPPPTKADRIALKKEMAKVKGGARKKAGVQKKAVVKKKVSPRKKVASAKPKAVKKPTKVEKVA